MTNGLNKLTSLNWIGASSWLAEIKSHLDQKLEESVGECLPLKFPILGGLVSAVDKQVSNQEQSVNASLQRSVRSSGAKFEPEPEPGLQFQCSEI